MIKDVELAETEKDCNDSTPQEGFSCSPAGFLWYRVVDELVSQFCHYNCHECKTNDDYGDNPIPGEQIGGQKFCCLSAVGLPNERDDLGLYDEMEDQP